MTAGKVRHAALSLLDRQLVDDEGHACGKVDDIELAPMPSEPDGPLYVTAIRCGPGALLTRLGARRIGAWLERVARLSDEGEDRGRVAIAKVRDIGDHISLSVRREDLATYNGERWVRDHVIAHIPGSQHAGE
jgi:sporulation protein YlmC with PRC-barrel domain